ncbi:MAG: hypothetical protein AAGJ46_04420 [Planctomycetota bacterium]
MKRSPRSPRATRREKPATRRSSRRLQYESLESRQMLSAEDLFARNDTIQTAFELGLVWEDNQFALPPPTFQATFDSAADVDWFRFTTTAPATSFGDRLDSVAVDDFGWATTGQPLVYRLHYRSLIDGQVRPVESAQIVGFPEALPAQTTYYSIANVPATEFFIETRPNPLANPLAVSYGIRIDAPSVQVDGFESNETFATATPLTAPGRRPAAGVQLLPGDHPRDIRTRLLPLRPDAAWRRRALCGD